MPYKDKEKKREHDRKYYQTHKEQKREHNSKYYQTHKEKKAEIVRRWIKEHPERRKEMRRKWKSKRRHNLGFNPLNEWFEGSNGHHINFNDVIYIPKDLHRSIPHCLETGKNMALINSIAYQFLVENYIVYK